MYFFSKQAAKQTCVTHFQHIEHNADKLQNKKQENIDTLFFALQHQLTICNNVRLRHEILR